MSETRDPILPGTGRGTIRRRANGGGGSTLRKPEVYSARKLRRNLSLPEAILWKQLQGDKLGFGVRRQHPVRPYVVDFYVPRARLIIEIDGEAHNRGARPVRDEHRDAFLSNKGYRVIRINAVDVLTNMEGVIAGIVAEATRPLHHQAVLDGPPPRAGEDL